MVQTVAIVSGVPVVAAFLALTGLTAGSFLFRREKKRDKRWDAYDELFAGLNDIYEQASLLKPDWRDYWQQREEERLPPKYDAEYFEYPDIYPAIYCMRFAVRLLQQNRWKSKVSPLFEQVDERRWSQVWGTVNHFSARLIIIQNSYRDELRADEMEWIEQTVEQFDTIRYRVRQHERGDVPRHQIVAEATYGSLHAAMNLSDRLINRLRFDATGEAI